MGGGDERKTKQNKPTFNLLPCFMLREKKLLNIILYFCIKQIGCDAQTCA